MGNMYNVKEVSMSFKKYLKEEICPVCLSNTKIHYIMDIHGIFINCPKCGIFFMNENVFDKDLSMQCKLRSCFYYYLTHERKNYNTQLIPYFSNICDDNVSETLSYNEYIFKIITIKSILNIYPYDIDEKVNKIMMNLFNEAKYIGNVIKIGYNTSNLLSHYLFFLDESHGYDSIDEQYKGIIKILEDINYIETVSSDYFNKEIIISFDGWKLINDYQNKNNVLSQAFIAMWFDKSMEKIKATIIKVIDDSGYMPMVIDLKEHNNQIVPEIFFEIKKSQFIIADLTGNRAGVYYEAGYAEGLGKTVIISCRDDEFDKIHFDIKQKNAVKWSNQDDLYDKLYKRIEATIGLRKK